MVEQCHSYKECEFTKRRLANLSDSFDKAIEQRNDLKTELADICKRLRGMP